MSKTLEKLARLGAAVVGAIVLLFISAAVVFVVAFFIAAFVFGVSAFYIVLTTPHGIPPLSTCAVMDNSVPLGACAPYAFSSLGFVLGGVLAGVNVVRLLLKEWWD